MKALKVITSIIGYAGIAVSALMFFIGETGEGVFMLLASCFLLWIRQRIGADPRPRRGEPKLSLLSRLAGWLQEHQSQAKETPPPALDDSEYQANRLKIYREKAAQITRAAPSPVPDLGFYNFPSFAVRGRKASTKRINTVHVRARDANSAGRYAARLRGLVEPLEVARDPFEPAVGVNDYGISIPRGACRDDELALIWSMEAHDDLPIPPAFMQYVTECDVPMSWLSGRDHAAQAVLDLLDDRSKAELYGYAVDCSLHGWTPGNIVSSPRLNKYRAFAEAASKDARALSSITGRPGSDIWKPAKNTVAYTFAEKYFQ